MELSTVDYNIYFFSLHMQFTSHTSVKYMEVYHDIKKKQNFNKTKIDMVEWAQLFQTHQYLSTQEASYSISHLLDTVTGESPLITAGSTVTELPMAVCSHRAAGS